MAVARSLRQFTPTLMTHLLSTTVHGSHLCGLHQQIPCTLISLTHLSIASQSQQCSSQAWRHCKHQFSHQGQTSCSLQASQQISHLACCFRRKRRSSLDNFSGSHMHSPWHQHRGFATDSDEADKIKYPVRTPDSVFVYSGPWH